MPVINIDDEVKDLEKIKKLVLEKKKNLEDNISELFTDKQKDTLKVNYAIILSNLSFLISIYNFI